MPAKLSKIKPDANNFVTFSFAFLYMDKESDNKIIERIISGDRQAYAYLVDRYKGPIYNLAFRMTGHHQQTEDLAQEIFLRAYQSLDKFDASRRFFSWLYTLALNLLRNHLKKRKPLRLHDARNTRQKLEVADHRNPELIVNEMEQCRLLSQKIQALPVSQKEAVVLRYYQDLSFEDIAEILDISLSAAKMRVYRGLARLSELLKKEETC